MERLFELLFKYRPLVFAKGRFAFTAGETAMVVAVLVVLLAVVAALGYRRVRGRVTPRDRGLLLGLRLAALALLALALLRPTLIVSTAVPERNVVALLLDDSRSMTIAEDGRTARAEVVRRLFGDPEAGVPARLADRFHLRWFRVGPGAERIAGPDRLTAGASRSDLGRALDDARRDLAALPLAGLVLVSDGADNADSSLTPSLLALAAQGIPVFTVGIGQERFPDDVELSRVEASRAALQGSSIQVEALVRRHGSGRDSAELRVEEGGTILASRRFALPGDGQATTVRLPVALTEPGPRALTVTLPPLPGETETRNNTREVLVVVRAGEERVLYFEGEPRFEFAFLRRAAAGDSNIRVVGLQRTADNKFLRLGVEDSLDLIGGFPRSREELFRYRALVLGSVEAAAFTVEQLRMVSDFVGRRGGGVLFLGGPRALGEGGYRNTPLEDLFPVLIDQPAESGWLRELRVSLTPAGRGHPMTLLGREGPAAERQWDSMPPLTSVNRVGRPKPGAIVLLAGRDTAGRGEQPVLAYHRFGRGRAAALLAQDVWLWRMHADMPVGDPRFEAFWRQVMRWLTSEVPDRVSITALTDRVAPGEPVVVTAEVRDEGYQGVNGAAVVARVTGPSGDTGELPMTWTAGADGQYRTAFPAPEAGRYRVEVQAGDGAAALRSEPAYATAGEVGREFFGAERRTGLLRRIAEETGGRFYTAETVDRLPEDIVYTERGITTTERLDLWDMPIVFLLLAGLLAAEWTLRRRRGLA